jgi:signal transduction histidine kinase/ligand-binding sensor domain-containing protein
MNQARRAAANLAISGLMSLLWATHVLAQVRSLDISQYAHTSWNAQDGYFGGSAHSVSQASDGNLWLTSNSGVLRFDGVRFVALAPPTTDSLPGHPIQSVFGSKNGSLWIGGAGLVEITTAGEFRRYHELDKLEIEIFAEDKDGGIWAGGAPVHGSPPLCRVHGGKVDCYGDDRSMVGVKDLYSDEQGHLWAGAADGVWRVYPGPPERVATQDYVAAVRTDKTGTLIFSSGLGIQTLSKQWEVGSGPILIEGKPIKVLSMFKDREGALWIGTRGQGLVHVHEGRVDRFTTLDGLSSDLIYAIFQDREGSLWAASSSGLDRFTKTAVTRITRKQGLSSDEVLTVLADRRSGVWIGTQGGLDQLIGDRIVESKVKLPSVRAASMIETSKGRLLVTTITDNGMVWLEKDKAVPLKAKSGASTFEIAQDDHGDLWMVNRELGLLHLHANGDAIKTIKWKELKMGSYSVVFDPNRQGLWLGSPDGELALFKDGKVVERFGPTDGLGAGVLRDIQVDHDGAVWVSTQIGLARLMNGKIQTLGTKNGLPCDITHWMRRDDDQNVWLYTECGLVSFSDKDLASWIAQPTYRVTVKKHFDNTDGVECTGYNGWYSPQATKMSDGRVLFAMTTGLGVLDPRNLNQNTLAPPVQIEEVFVDGKTAQRSDHLLLPKRSRTVRLTYTALSLVAPRKVKFRYRLEGFDSNWSEPVSLREATYTNLPPGDYKFRVIACNNDGVWNEAGASLTFSIAPAFYQMTWFRVFCAAAFLLLLWAAYRVRVQRLQRQFAIGFEARMNERSRIARELHDTLLQTFQGLILNFQRARNLLPGRPDEALKSLDTALEKAESAIMEGRDAIHDIRDSAPHEFDLAEVLSALGKELASEKGNSALPVFHVVVEGTAKTMNPVVSEEIYRIAREALRNAYHHSHARNIEAEISYEKELLKVRVRDDGSGISENHLGSSGRAGHYGLQGMRERAARIGAGLDIWSKDGAGAEIELRVPHTIAYAAGRRQDNFGAAGSPGTTDANKS